MIGLPPSLVGVVQLTCAEVGLATVAVTPVGVLGTFVAVPPLPGTTELLAPLDAEPPTSLYALTVNE